MINVKGPFDIQIFSSCDGTVDFLDPFRGWLLVGRSRASELFGIYSGRSNFLNHIVLITKVGHTCKQV